MSRSFGLQKLSCSTERKKDRDANDDHDHVDDKKTTKKKKKKLGGKRLKIPTKNAKRKEKGKRGLIDAALSLPTLRIVTPTEATNGNAFSRIRMDAKNNSTLFYS